MGKAARVRKRRREEARRRDAEPDIERLVEALQPIRTPAQFDRLVNHRPALFGPAMLDYLQGLADDLNIETFAGRLIRLVERAQSDPAGAWLVFRREMDEAWVQAREYEPVFRQLEDLINDGAFEDAIRLGEGNLPAALQLGFGHVIAEIHARLADAFRLRVSGDPTENSDAAIAHTEAALVAATDLTHLVSLQTNLAVLFAGRKNGDPAENLERAIEILRDALRQLGGRDLGDLRATMQTNLARALQTRERGDRLDNLREAHELCSVALEWRSLDRNAEDWAYSKIDFAAITADLAILGEADPTDAVRHLLDVIEAADEVGVPWLIGAARGSLGGLYRRSAERIAEEENRIAFGTAKPPPPGEAEAERLRTARDHLQAAVALLDPESQRDLVGRALDNLGAVHEALGAEDEAIEPYRRALGVLRPKSTPAECQHAGARLGTLLAERENWDGSAAAYTMAVAASESGFHARLETADRAAEIERIGSVARWAAFSLAKSGDIDAALLVLENSRTRELRRRLDPGADESLIAQLPFDARVDYLQALADLSVASFGSDSDEAGRRLQEVLTAIRRLPRFEEFAKGVSWSEIASAVEPGSPLVYVNPTPFGTVILSVCYSDSGITTAAKFLDSPSSSDVFRTLVFGDLTDPSAPASYLIGIAGQASEDPKRFRRALGYVLGVLGEEVARPLAECLGSLGATGVTIVACGPISLAPLHAANWSTSSGELSLVDLFNVRFTPSATLHGACLRRVRQRANRLPRLTALANPISETPNSIFRLRSRKSRR